jgi:hypothetical protein
MAKAEHLSVKLDALRAVVYIKDRVIKVRRHLGMLLLMLSFTCPG